MVSICLIQLIPFLFLLSISFLNLSFGFTATTTTVVFRGGGRERPKPTTTKPSSSSTCSKLFYANDDGRNNDRKDNNNNDDECDEEYDEIVQTPYRNRSLAWTNNYRKLFPYESARRHAISLGLSTKEEWLDRAGGPYMIKRPDKMYQEEWVSWEEFLGTMRPYNETKQLVQMILQIKTMDDYILFVRSDSLRAAGLRIPVRPDLYYKTDWEGPEDFFGTTN